MDTRIPVPHPGETLQEDFLEPLGISQSKLAREIGVDARRINNIINGKRNITADTAIRLGIYFGIEPEYWTNLQSFYDLRTRFEDVEFSRAITKIEPIVLAPQE